MKPRGRTADLPRCSSPPASPDAGAATGDDVTGAAEHDNHSHGAGHRRAPRPRSRAEPAEQRRGTGPPAATPIRVALQPREQPRGSAADPVEHGLPEPERVVLEQSVLDRDHLNPCARAAADARRGEVGPVAGDVEVKPALAAEPGLPGGEVGHRDDQGAAVGQPAVHPLQRRAGIRRCSSACHSVTVSALPAGTVGRLKLAARDLGPAGMGVKPPRRVTGRTRATATKRPWPAPASITRAPGALTRPSRRSRSRAESAQHGSWPAVQMRHPAAEGPGRVQVSGRPARASPGRRAARPRGRPSPPSRTRRSARARSGRRPSRGSELGHRAPAAELRLRSPDRARERTGAGALRLAYGAP